MKVIVTVVTPNITTTLSQTTQYYSSGASQVDIREAQLADSITGPILQAKQSTPPQKFDGRTLCGKNCVNCLHNGISLSVLNNILYHAH